MYTVGDMKVHGPGRAEGCRCWEGSSNSVVMNVDPSEVSVIRVPIEYMISPWKVISFNTIVQSDWLRFCSGVMLDPGITCEGPLREHVVFETLSPD
jgi:hypothetical protein